MANKKDELFNEMVDMLERMLHGELGCGPKNVNENEVNQLIREARCFQSSDKTMEHISNALFGGRHAG